MQETTLRSNNFVKVEGRYHNDKYTVESKIAPNSQNNAASGTYIINLDNVLFIKKENINLRIILTDYSHFLVSIEKCSELLDRLNVKLD